MSAVEAFDAMPIPKPNAGESHDAYIGRCVSAIHGEYGQDQALAICYNTWRDSKKKSHEAHSVTLTPNEQLVQSIRERKSSEPFNSGIITADRYVKTIDQCVGHELCNRYAATQATSWHDLLRKSAQTLTYNNPEMVAEDIYDKAYQWQEPDPQGDVRTLTLPKHTLMVFKHVLTTSRRDRDGDIMRTGGAKPDPKMALLWNHVHTLPIGKMLHIDEHTENKLTVVSALIDINSLAHDAAVMIEAKMGRFSHGFKAIEFEKNKEGGGFDIKQFEVMEESLVTVPSNVDAEETEILLGLVESKKLTSPLLKEMGKSIRDKRDKSVNVQIDVSSLEKENGTKDTTEGTGTKCSGDAGCSCGCSGAGASEKADADADGEKRTDDKEVMLCPKCNERMVDGVCTKCGYRGKSLSKSHSGSFRIGDRVKVKPGASHDSMTKDRTGTIKEVGTNALGILFDGMQSIHKWYVGDELESVSSASKNIAGGEKAGRMISGKNRETLQHAHDCVGEIHEKEYLLSKAGKALCKDAMSSIKSILDLSDGVGTASTDDIDEKGGPGSGRRPGGGRRDPFAGPRNIYQQGLQKPAAAAKPPAAEQKPKPVEPPKKPEGRISRALNALREILRGGGSSKPGRGAFNTALLGPAGVFRRGMDDLDNVTIDADGVKMIVDCFDVLDEVIDYDDELTVDKAAAFFLANAEELQLRKMLIALESVKSVEDQTRETRQIKQLIGK